MISGDTPLNECTVAELAEYLNETLKSKFILIGPNKAREIPSAKAKEFSPEDDARVDALHEKAVKASNERS